MDILVEEKQEVKRRFQLWIKPSTLDLTEQFFHQDNCSSKSEFIEKAIRFYIGYVTSNHAQDYFSQVIPATVKGIVDESANRMGRLLFKIAVEMAVVENILAAVCDVDELEVTRLRGQFVKEIKSTNGLLSFEEALRWQRDG